MDRVIDVIFDPKVLLAAVVGWTLHEIVTTRANAPGARSAQQMAGSVVARQVDVAKKHVVNRAQSLADERTRAVVDSFFPRAKTTAEQQIIQLTVPK